jgi:hypothetical protein
VKILWIVVGVLLGGLLSGGVSEAAFAQNPSVVSVGAHQPGHHHAKRHAHKKHHKKHHQKHKHKHHKHHGKKKGKKKAAASGSSVRTPVQSPAAPAAPQQSAPIAALPQSFGVPAGTSLTAAAGRTITVDGTVIDAKDISGAVTIDADNVVISRSRITGNGSGTGLYVHTGSVLIKDSEVRGFDDGIAGSNWTASHVDIHSMSSDGVKLGSDVVLQDSHIHDLTPGPDAHADGGQMQSGVRNLLVQRNIIDVSSAPSANAALFLAPDMGPSTEGPVRVLGNYLDGGTFTLYCVDGGNGRYYVSNITIAGNTFGAHPQHGNFHVNVPVTWSNNVSL